MPTLTINGKSQEFSEDTRLVLAIEQMGIQIGHRCGGQGRCTTCRVSFDAGEPEQMTQVEFDKLQSQGLLETMRLSCQLTCNQDMTLSVPMTLENQNWTDTGPAPSDAIEPEPEWHTKAELTG
jgi:ferredoxin